MTEALIGAAATVIAAAVGVLVAHKLRTRGPSDKDQFQSWREVFDRGAFKGPYIWNSAPEPFLKAISDTLRAVNTGVAYGRPPGSGKGKGRIRSKSRRAEMDVIERELSQIKRSVQQAAEVGKHLDPALAKQMDVARDDIIRRLNAIWSDLGIPTLPLPTDVTTFPGGSE